MENREYEYEGKLLKSCKLLQSADDESLYRLMENGTILEGRARLCDSEHNVYVGFCGREGIIPKGECVYSQTGEVRDIAVISRVGKPICFKIVDIVKNADGTLTPMLSRREAQKECMRRKIEKLIPGDIISARITRLDPFGAFCDVGCGISSLLPIDCMSVSRINHPRERFFVGQIIKAVVRTSCDENGRISLSHRELLGSWEENISRFSVGQTAFGIVRSIETYGVFVELAPNLAGLAEQKEGVSVGQYAAVYIKNIVPEKMKIKLVIIDVCEGERGTGEYVYEDISHIDYWRYSPDCSEKIIESCF